MATRLRHRYRKDWCVYQAEVAIKRREQRVSSQMVRRKRKRSGNEEKVGKPRNRRNQIHTKTKIVPAPLTPLKILGLPLSAVWDDVEEGLGGEMEQGDPSLYR